MIKIGSVLNIIGLLIVVLFFINSFFEFPLWFNFVILALGISFSFRNIYLNRFVSITVWLISSVAIVILFDELGIRGNDLFWVIPVLLLGGFLFVRNVEKLDY